MEASIKKWCVGSPIQSVLDATQALIDEHGVKPDNAKRIVITMPDDRMHIVNNGHMPDVCVQHLVAMSIVDGTVTFASVHDHDRMGDPAVQAVRKNVELVGSSELTVAKPARQGIVEVELNDGRKVRHHAVAVRGTPDNPMTTKEIETKAIDLVAPISGEAKANGPGEGDRRRSARCARCASCGRCCRPRAVLPLRERPRLSVRVDQLEEHTYHRIDGYDVDGGATRRRGGRSGLEIARGATSRHARGTTLRAFRGVRCWMMRRMVATERGAQFGFHAPPASMPVVIRCRHATTPDLHQRQAPNEADKDRKVPRNSTN